MRESYSKGANPPRADWGLWFWALTVPGILHNSLPFGGWMRNALKTFCIRTAVMGKLHRGMLTATFKLHAGLRKSFFFFLTRETSTSERSGGNSISCQHFKTHMVRSGHETQGQYSQRMLVTNPWGSNPSWTHRKGRGYFRRNVHSA